MAGSLTASPIARIASGTTPTPPAPPPYPPALRVEGRLGPMGPDRPHPLRARDAPLDENGPPLHLAGWSCFFASSDFSLASSFGDSCSTVSTPPRVASTVTSSVPLLPAVLKSNE